MTLENFNPLHNLSMKKIFIITLVVLAIPLSAHQPIVERELVPEFIEIPDPEISFAYYGELTGEPQKFIISSESVFNLYVQVLEPEIPGAQKNHSAVIYDGDKNVVADLLAEDADWESYFEFFGGDYYINGPEYNDNAAASGSYEVVVSSPDNLGKYVLVTGKIEDFSDTSFLATVKEIYRVKIFFEKNPLSILQTPFVYVPVVLTLILLGIAGLIGRSMYRKKKKTLVVK
jgi:hypothetical protein